ncbi:hypothetical protein GGR50DRAFT_702053 [Xylaria sp. CBS 124048]|nr:hypothetical protein GGR50DRAFT_702053 [Xylaria sp. CBS 124048]
MSPVPYVGTIVAHSSTAMMPNAYHHVNESARKGASGGAVYGGSGGPSKAHFNHIDDIVSVTVDLDPNTPLRKVLEAGDAHMRQAITYKDFGRIEWALQEYIKATTIALDVEKHKDYPALKTDRGDLNRLYHALTVKITNNGVAYERIKEIIKEDNLRSGVRPRITIQKSSEHPPLDLPSVPSNLPLQQQPIDHRDTIRSSHVNGHSRSASKNEDSTRAVSQPYESSSSSHKTKPIVHPKPPSLHGNSVKSTSDEALPDLVARFANLRNSQESRSASSSTPRTKPIGPRAMPSSYTIPLSVNSSLPTMPKVPDAVYSPARGAVTSEAASLPSSTPRSMFSRTNSLVSAPSRTSTESVFRPSHAEQFVAAHAYGDPRASSTSNIRIPKGELITVKELICCMDDASAYANTKILLIDVRDRQLFDEGHIMSQNTICLDPTILLRQDISANEIVDSMILAPANEKAAFEHRDEVDLIVFYDQDAQTIPQRITGNAQETILFNLRRALVEFSFPKLRHTPKLLVGGLDAWVDQMGKQSLQTSKTQSVLRHATSTSTSTRQRLKNRALKPDEVNTFEAMIGRDENGDFDYAKSKDDFMRRFPSLRAPESMVSGDNRNAVAQTARLGGEEFLKDMTPTPPVRPKPSVARTRYSGLESVDEHAFPGSGAMVASASANPQRYSNPTGLVNPHNWCYANASIQALLVCRGFVDEFLDPQWPTKYRPKVTPVDPAHNQLMCKILGNLFQWLSQRSFANMKASTLMHYLRTIHSGYSIGSGQMIRFGDTHQHDSDELITFIFGQLEVETRINLTMNPLPQLDTAQPVGFVADRWVNRGNHNIISRYWYLMELQTLTCKACGATNFIPEEAERYQFSVSPDHDNGTLDALIQKHFEEFDVETQCDKCGTRGKTLRRQIVRMPPLLRIGIQRTNQSSSKKVLRHLKFPFDGLDLGHYALEPQQRARLAKLVGGEAADGFDCSTRYDLFAVVAHSGKDLNQGHYISYVKTQGTKWTCCNDVVIEPNIPTTDLRWMLYECYKGFTPVQLYYRRVDTTR